MSQLGPLLAHLGADGDPWLGILTVAAAIVAVVFVLAALGRVRLDEPGDLLLPLAAVVLFAGLGGSLGDAAADQAPWALPLAVVLLGALVLAATTDLDLGLTRPLGYGALALAAVAALALRPTLETTFFPPVLALPQADDAVAELVLVDGPDDEGRVTVELSVTGGTIGAGPQEQDNEDLEDGMVPRFVAGPAFVRPAEGPSDCPETCTSTTYELVLPVTGDGALPARIQVELLTAAQVPFAPPVTAAVDVPQD